jgi:uncharacterized protein
MMRDIRQRGEGHEQNDDCGGACGGRDVRVLRPGVDADGSDAAIHPTLKTIALYLNTLAHNGVPASHRHIAAVFHQGGGDAALTNEVYKARHNGATNPNIALLHELKQAGVELRVCGQGLLGKKLEPKDVLPDVQVDLWAMTTMVNLQLRGYVRIGG